MCTKWKYIKIYCVPYKSILCVGHDYGLETWRWKFDGVRRLRLTFLPSFPLIFFPFLTVIMIYFWFVVLSLYFEIRDARRRGEKSLTGVEYVTRML